MDERWDFEQGGEGLGVLVHCWTDLFGELVIWRWCEKWGGWVVVEVRKGGPRKLSLSSREERVNEPVERGRRAGRQSEGSMTGQWR